MELQIREARSADALAIYKLNTEEMKYEFPFEQTRKQLETSIHRTTEKVFVATVGGQVVGYVHAQEYELLYAPPLKNILGLAVSREYKRMGIGKRLLQKVEEWALLTGATGVCLNSGAERKEAHLFYKKCGYEKGKQQVKFLKRLIKE